MPTGAVVSTRRRRATLKELRQDATRQTITEQVATWRDRTGEKRTAVVIVGVDGSQRVRVESETYYAEYRDGGGLVQVVSTCCRDKQAAQTRLTELERTADKVRSGTLVAAELKTADHNKTPTTKHIADYIEYLKSKGTHRDRVKTTETRLKELVAVCGFDTLRELNADALLGWLSTEQAAGRSLSVLNGYIAAAVAFGYWLTGKRSTKNRSNQLGEKRLMLNPFAGVGKFDERADRRRERRAMTEQELRRLLYVARWRPIAEYGRESERLPVDELPTSTSSRKTWTQKPLTFETIQAALESARCKLVDKPDLLDELDRRGRERALVYKLAVLTGCRRGEIESLTVGSLDLGAGILRLRPQDTKNGEPAELPLRADLVADLRDWMELRRTEVNREVIAMRPADRLPLETPLFNVPRQFVKILDRDLAAAEIAKSDERGRTIDFHALRFTFGTLLSVGGVAPRTAQKAMRHSHIDLTMNVYTDPKLLDLAGAVELLPTLHLDAEPETATTSTLQATGTETAESLVAVNVAGTSDKTLRKLSNSGNSGEFGGSSRNTKKPHNSLGITGFSLVGPAGFEPTTSTTPR